MVRFSLFAGLAVLLATPHAAHAWQIESPVTNSCHERITMRAVTAAGYPDGMTSPPSSKEERVILDDVPFTVPDEYQNSWGLALLVGVRNNDLEEHDPTNLAQLGTLHNDPKKQDAHCLREIGDDGPAGDQIAIDRCKLFILNELSLALGEGDTVDITARAMVPTNLKFRQKTTLDINNMAFHMGRAMHALEDGYTHILRDSNTDHVRSVLNWIEGNLAGMNYDEARDGFPHIGVVDDCTLTDELTKNRLMRSTAAATALVNAIALPMGGKAGRLARASAVLDTSFQLDPGCTIDNDYCNAPEIQLTSCGCETRGGTGLLPGLLVIGLFLLRRRRHSAAIATIATALMLVVTTLPARADTASPKPTPAPTKPTPTPDPTPTPTPTPAPTPGSTQPTSGPAGPVQNPTSPVPTTTTPASDGTPVPVAPVGLPVVNGSPQNDKVEEKVIDQSNTIIDALPDPTTKRWGFAAALSGSAQRGGAAIAAGVRWNRWKSLGLGLDIEWNPYIAFSQLSAQPGTLQVYVPIIWKIRKFGNIELRSTFGVGASMLLFDLVQANKGSIGPYVDWNPLGVAFSFGANIKLVVKPGDISVPIPELVGFPFYYPQYRFTIGLEWYP